jgi:hypothetical protein
MFVIGSSNVAGCVWELKKKRAGDGFSITQGEK